jgi:hypothetical protein
MKWQEIVDGLRDALNIDDVETVSLYSRIDEDTGAVVDAEREYGMCELGSTEDYGDVVPCVGRSRDGRIVEFRVASDLAHGRLGSMLGYF